MTALASPFPVSRPRRHFTNAAEWHHALGDVPLQRIVFDPVPATATEADLLRLVERDNRLCELIDGTLVEKAVGFREDEAIPTIAPDLAVQVLSDSNTVHEIALKLTNSFNPVRVWSWVIDRLPRTVAIYYAPGNPATVLGEHGTLNGEQVMPGLNIAVADLFRNVPR